MFDRHRMEDAELISRVGRGDRGAFALLYERHAKAVYNFAWMLARSVPDAEDVTQECFLALARKPRAFDPARAQLRTWLLAVARNQLMQRRRRAARGALPISLDPADLAPDPEQDLIDLEIAVERAAAVRNALDRLPELQREALYLFEFEGLTLAEAAAVLGIEANAVKARLFRAREQMKRLLAPLRPVLSWKG
ncbi:MAG TPA: RNA polymerase sigma factor, partial [Bryobacteraceae bacterium]|nr:RNA polymerase sigma factor [Bryobacteraceae bacterium]